MEDADLKQEFAVFKTEVKGDLRALSISVDSIARQLDSVVAMRDDITKMSANYEQWRNEKETMWARVDGLREDMKALREEELAEVRRELHQWEGASKLARTFFGIALGVIVTVVGWTINEVRHVSVMAEKVRVLESHDHIHQDQPRK